MEETKEATQPDVSGMPPWCTEQQEERGVFTTGIAEGEPCFESYCKFTLQPKVIPNEGCFFRSWCLHRDLSGSFSAACFEAARREIGS